MDIRKLFFSIVPLCGFIIFISILTWVFFLRPPIYLVSDIYSHTLYGAEWERVQIFETSLLLRRRIAVFRIMEATDSQAIAKTIASARRKPHSVFFPYRYAEAARYYAGDIAAMNNTTTMVFLILSRMQDVRSGESVIGVSANSESNYYHAGLCAALLTRLPRISSDENLDVNNIIGFASDIPLSGVERALFKRGVTEGGFFRDVRFIMNRETIVQDNFASIVIEAAAAVALQSVNETPAILLSWFSNTNYIPSNIKMIIDDSPYVLIPKVLNQKKSALQKGSVINVPMDFIIVKKNIENKEIIKGLQKALKAKTPRDISGTP